MTAKGPVDRLPEVRTLADILPKGTEGGKEFARLVSLLLFAESRRSQTNLTLFDDAAGDYHGLDSFGSSPGRSRSGVGYQFKFYSSPLSADHRREIQNDLKKAVTRKKDSKIQRWVLVTPTDLLETSRRGGGDVSWFAQLQQSSRPLIVEHWGHRKLLAMFLETPTLLLRYYPELHPRGIPHRRSIDSIRDRYVAAQERLHRSIEFVGMSVYKPEATRGIPMEDIYIPLDVAPWSSDVTGSTRIDPLALVAPDSSCVLLGDPGSGKSTLLKFVALVGHSKALQIRTGWKPDDRLPVLVSLRRYADALRADADTSLMDFIKRTAKADFNLPAADEEFFLYFLESGQTLLLFDGLDELPNPSFKEIVRDRIRTLLTSYPGNTVWVTSRIVGYSEAFKFDDNEFRHYRVAPLRMQQIERFVDDWYRVRVDDPRERSTNVKDLLRIVQERRSQAIRDLAENPLLLTIIALVHRIDAVLPDERVVLYQKCTETLLNTWHTWKARSDVLPARGRIERRNRRRIEALAWWMHNRAGDADRGQRSVVPESEIASFLQGHIESVEGPSDENAEDAAATFLEFVRKKAGLLIEVGDGAFSFLHLTFQEYLASTHLLGMAELGGAQSLWETLASRVDDPRWHEVARLAIAGLKSNDTQAYLVERLLEVPERGPYRVQLLGGLLLDNVDALQPHEATVLNMVAVQASQARDEESLAVQLGILRAYRDRGTESRKALRASLAAACRAEAGGNRLPLVALALGERGVTYRFARGSIPRSIEGLGQHDEGVMRSYARVLDAMVVPMALTSPATNLIAAILGAVGLAHRRAVVLAQLAALGSGTQSGPFGHFNSNLLLLQEIDPDHWRAVARKRTGRGRTMGRPGQIDELFQELRTTASDPDSAYSQARELATDRLASEIRAQRRRLSVDRLLGLRPSREIVQDIGNAVEVALRGRSLGVRVPKSAQDLNKALWSSPELQTYLVDIVVDATGLLPKPHWKEALRTLFAKAFSAPPRALDSLEDLTNRYGSGRVDADTQLKATSRLFSAAWQSVSGIGHDGPAALKLVETSLASRRSRPLLGIAVYAASNPSLVPPIWRDLVPALRRDRLTTRLLIDAGLSQDPD